MDATITARPRADLIVIGASAGGVETLVQVIAGLPADLPAAVLVVLHVSATSPGLLPDILDRAGEIPVQAAHDGIAIEPGHVYVAPPDLHLTVVDGVMHLASTERVNGHRPAVDPLFCSAADARGRTVVGVVLSGNRDDGTAGLARIKACGGTAVVQDPEEAHYRGMPSSAIANVEVDAVLPTDRIADALVALAAGRDVESEG